MRQKSALALRVTLTLVALLTVWGSLAAQSSAGMEGDVEQGWSPGQKADWYSKSQGSRLIPWRWLEALEQPLSDRRLLEPGYLAQFRYLPGSPAGDTPTLPLGFVLDDQPDDKFSEITRLRWFVGQGSRERWVGMTCAACHTGELTYKTRRLRIEGAPAMADYQGFIRSLDRALEATQSDPEKWSRFRIRVLGDKDTSENRQMLRREFGRYLRWQLQLEAANDTTLAYGYGRLDAFGHIFNKVALRIGGEMKDRNPSDAPVSYPFLWNIHQHDKVQWNGIAPNSVIGGDLDLGALARNVGEVVGVFADLQVLPWGPALNGYPTSARVENLIALERLVGQLKPPAWPKAFPPIDAERWDRGRVIFTRQGSCAGCHAVLARDDLTTPIKAKMIPLSGPQGIGTDPWMACNAYSYAIDSGKLQRTPSGFFWGTPHREREQVANLLGTVVIGSVYQQKVEVASDLAKQMANLKPFAIQPLSPEMIALGAKVLRDPAQPDAKDTRLRACMHGSHEALAYKARPLTGVWATGPFLHNGSVPTLYDLLLPPSQRPVVFSLGTREFDPVRVGFTNEHSTSGVIVPSEEGESGFVFRVYNASGEPIAGNSNGGHDYGNASLTEADRWALVEYMKAVGAKRDGDRIRH